MTDATDFRTLMHVLTDRVVLVTGGTGSFGKAFIQAALAHGSPAKLIVLSRDEQKHYTMGRELTDPRLRFFVGGYSEQWGYFAAGSIIVAIPVVLLFLFLQKYLVSGLTAGAVKG